MKYLSLVLIVYLSFSATAKNYYVSKSGFDSNAGTKEAPFLTISKASTALSAGDTCFIMSGIYREVLEPLQSGQPGKPIVYINYQNDTVRLMATEKSLLWEVFNGNIYKTSFKMSMGRQNMVFCNGEAMDWARWPNNTDNDPYTVDAEKVTTGSGSTIESSAINGTNWAGGYVWYLGAHSGTSWTRKITASQPGKITFEGVDITKWPFNPHNPTVWRNGNRGQFYIFGKLEALDKEREWYFDEATSTLYFQAPGNENPNSLNIEIAQRERTINITKNYIHVAGLNAFGGKAEISGTDCEIRNCRFDNCLQILDELDNTDAQVADAPVLVRASRTLIHNNIIDGSSLNGIYVQGWNGVTEVTISNNLIKNCNTVGIHASPIRSGSTYTKMISNTLHTTGRDGIYCGGTNCEIAWNDVYDVMRINNDGGLFYVVGNASDKNNEVHHNWFHDSWGPEYADGRCAGIYLDNNSKGYSVHHNVVWNITWTGIQINWDNWNIDIFNNTIYNAKDGAMGRWENGYTIKDLVIKNNYASKGEWIGTDVSSGSNRIISSSPFVSAENKDFRPKAGSFLVNQGEVIPGITDGYLGNFPDIGAYEYGADPWIPGVKSTGLTGPFTSVNEIRKQVDFNRFKIYPNPFSHGTLKLDFAEFSGEKQISVFSGAGKLVLKMVTNNSFHIISRSVFVNSGVYVIWVETDSKIGKQKIIVI